MTTKRVKREVKTVLSRMRQGCDLHLEYRWFGPHWCLSNGRRVDPEVARVVVQDIDVVPTGDSLFSNVPGQTWRFK